MIGCRELACCADNYALPVDAGFNTRTHKRTLLSGLRNGQPTLLGFAYHGLRQRVGRTLFHRGGQRQQGLFTQLSRWDNCGYLRFAERQGACFIKRHLGNATQLLQRRTTFNQRTVARSGGKT